MGNPNWKRLLYVAGMLIAGTLPLSASACGAKERWFVKVGTDPDAGLVQLAPIVPITVQGLNQLPKLQPTVPAGNDMVRLAAERVVYEVSAHLALFKHEGDSHYHLVI